jgi:predicted Zn finger-like uncharacterized protein
MENNGKPLKWIVVALITKCPECRSEFTDKGLAAMLAMRAGRVKCGHCGFEGEVVSS